MIAFHPGELVTVLSSRDPLPIEFTWRGRRHRIRRIDHYATRTFQNRQRIEHQRLFHLWTAGGLRVLLSQEVNRDVWRLEHIVESPGGVT